MIDYIWRAKQPYNVSVASETAACAALTDRAYMQVGSPAALGCTHSSRADAGMTPGVLPRAYEMRL